MLRELRDYALRLEAAGKLPPPMYQSTRIKWLVDLDCSGRLRGSGFINTTPDNAKGPEKRGKKYLAPHVVRTAGAIRPRVLADRADYSLGVCFGDGKSDKVALAHESFCNLAGACALDLGDPSIDAVVKFLGAMDESCVPPDLEAGDIVSFLVDGELLIGAPEVRRWWADHCAPEPDKAAARPCLACGQLRMPAKRHPVPVKGIPGPRPEWGCPVLTDTFLTLPESLLLCASSAPPRTRPA